MRNLVIQRVRFRRDARLDKALILKRLREYGGALIEQKARLLHMREREVRDSVEEFNVRLGEAGGADVAHVGAHEGEGCGEGGGGVRVHALILAKKLCFAIRYFRAK